MGDDAGSGALARRCRSGFGSWLFLAFAVTGRSESPRILLGACLVVALCRPLAAQQSTIHELTRLGAPAAALAALTAPQGNTTPAVRPAHTAAELQAALDRATPGTVIMLDAGVRYVGNFNLPARSATDAPVTVTSAANVPAAGVRVDPGAVLAILETPNNQPAVSATTGAHGYRFVGVMFKAGSAAANDLVRFGLGTEKASTLYPSGFVLDRVIIRGDPVGGAKRGVLANAHDVTLINSDVRNIFRAGQDTTAFGCFNCGTGYTLKNNHLEAGAEVVIFGGAESVARTVATDVLVEDNELTRPLAWRSLDRQVKNLFELKECLRCVIRHNVFFNHWVASQPGPAIVITPRDAGKSITDVRFENNVLYGTGSGFSISGRDNHFVTPLATSGLVFRNNLVILDAATFGGDGRLVTLTGAPKDITFDHNTLVTVQPDPSGAIVAAYDGGWMATAEGTMQTGGPVTGFRFTNNAVPNGSYGVIANGSMNGLGLTTYFPGIVMTGNILAGYTDRHNYFPAGNLYPALAAYKAMFVNYAGGDYRPGPSMPLGTDGKPIGADFSKLPAFR